MKIPKKYAMVWIAMIGMIGATLSMKNIAGLFFTPMSESFGVGRGAVSLTLTINNLTLAAGDYLAPRLYHDNNYKKLSCLCIGTVVGSTLLMGAVPGLMPFYLLSAVRGFASGMLGIVIGTVMINNWFVRYNSIATGVALAGAGIASAFLSPFLSGVIETSGWRAGFRAEAFAALILYAPLLLFPITFAPENQGLEPLGGRSGAGKTDIASAVTEGSRSGLLLPALILMNAFSNAVSVFTNHMPGVADSFALPAAVGAAMLSASMITNAGGKVMMGALAEKFGVKRPAILYISAIAAGFLLLNTVHTVPAALCSGAVIGLSFSLTTVVPALVTKDIFGQARYRSVFPLVALAGTAANASAASLIGFSYDAFRSYRPAMLTLITLLVCNILLLLALYRSKEAASQ